MNHLRFGRRILAGVVVVGLLTVASTLGVAASGPVISRGTTISYSLADALADFAADPTSYDVDCGTFKVIDTFQATRMIQTWSNREFRHIVYSGSYVNASDPTKMLPRNGDFERTTLFDANGDRVSTTQRGVQIWTVLDGRRVTLVAGIGIDENGLFTHHGLNVDQSMVCAPLS
ncbi:MAG: hypothetical protein HY264_01485 [Chloroflexi bacterium]|nr:hypothetical protein [Chloroflexota bacterium]